MRFSKYYHIIYQSIASFIYLQKNIRTLCSKPIKNSLQGSIALLGSFQAMNMKVSILDHVTYQSVANFEYFQKIRRTTCQNSNRNSPNHSKIPLPWLPISFSPCLPPEISQIIDHKVRWVIEEILTAPTFTDNLNQNL